MKLRGTRRTILALVLGIGTTVTVVGVGQTYSIASAPTTQHRLAGEAMPPIPQMQIVQTIWQWIYHP